MSVTLFHINTQLLFVLLGLILFVVVCVGCLTIVLLYLYGRLDHHRMHVQKILAHQQFPDHPGGATLRDQRYQYLHHIHRGWDALRLIPQRYSPKKRRAESLDSAHTQDIDSSV